MPRHDNLPVRRAILRFISQYTAKHGYAPSNVELCEEVGRNYAALRRHMTALREQGFLIYTGESRALALQPGALERDPQ